MRRADTAMELVDSALTTRPPLSVETRPRAMATKGGISSHKLFARAAIGGKTYSRDQRQENVS